VNHRFRRFLRYAVLGAVIAGCAALTVGRTAQPAARTPAYKLTDLTGAYTAFFDRTQDLALDARIAAFKADMNVRFPGFYDSARIPGMTPGQYDALISLSFTDFPQRRAAFTRTAASFQSMLRPAIESFVGTFGDFRNLGQIALVHSVGEMDGGTRNVRGKSYLVFGADMMSRLYAPGRSGRFFTMSCFTSTTPSSSPTASRCGARCGRRDSRCTPASSSIPAQPMTSCC
jgi:hypothetical protein